jgi:hypothetical protein
MCDGGLGVALGSLPDVYAIYVLFGSLNEPMPANDSQINLPKTPILSLFWCSPCTQQNQPTSCFQPAREFSEVPLSSRSFSVRS